MELLFWMAGVALNGADESVATGQIPGLLPENGVSLPLTAIPVLLMLIRA
jgi:hypothetical protein